MSELRELVQGRVHTVWARKDQLDAVGAHPDDTAKALADLERAEARGFLYCEAVFVDGSYDGLHEKAHPTSGSLNWGRGQDVVGRNYFRNGKLERDPEWQPDPPEAAWEAFGFRCEVRSNRIGYNCGYVGLPAGHPWFGKSYDACLLGDDCPTVAERAADPDGYHSCYNHSPDARVEVHGGLTFAQAGERDGLWWFGFDCAHSGDAPDPEYAREQERKYGLQMHHRDEHYWTVDEVRAETERLAEQLAQVGKS